MSCFIVHVYTKGEQQLYSQVRMLWWEHHTTTFEMVSRTAGVAAYERATRSTSRSGTPPPGPGPAPSPGSPPRWLPRWGRCAPRRPSPPRAARWSPTSARRDGDREELVLAVRASWHYNSTAQEGLKGLGVGFCTSINHLKCQYMQVI